MIRFIRIKDAEPVRNYITKLIRNNIRRGQKVLWLLPGGSAMKIAVSIADDLRSEKLSGLSVTLTDERYGPPGHKDSNWQQLKEAGFSLKGANLYEILNGKDLDQEARAYEDYLEKATRSADFSIALAGLGPDGHIFGIKPGSPAVKTPQGVIGYKWSDYIRLTPAISLLKQLDEVVVYAVGDDKHRQFDLLDNELPPEEHPAQLLKQLANVRIYNDYKGEQI